MTRRRKAVVLILPMLCLVALAGCGESDDSNISKELDVHSTVKSDDFTDVKDREMVSKGRGNSKMLADKAGFARGSCSVDYDSLTVVETPKSILSGSLVEIYPCERHKSNGYLEEFHSDGSWKFYEYGAVLVIHSGTWSVSDTEIVTNSETMGRVTRKLRRNEQGIYFIASMLRLRIVDQKEDVPVTIVKFQ